MAIVQYVKELFESWWGRLWLFLATISTLATFLPIYAHGFVVPRWIPPAVAIVAWLFAPYRLYTRQEEEIAQLQKRVTDFKTRKPRLLIHPGIPSAFYVHREPHQAAGGIGMNPLGTYLEVNLTIENAGEINSVVGRFDLHVDELGATFANVTPHPKQYLQTRNTNFALSQDFVSRSDRLLVPGKNFVKVIPPLYLDKSPANDVTALHCVLTAIGTDGETAKATFILSRSGD